MRFSFLHAADLHIDSPLESLGVKDAAVAARFARAGRAAVESLVSHALESEAKFLIIAGDIYDGDWRDVSTGHFFARALGELHRAEVPTFMIKGNHDAESVMSKSLSYPDSVRVFGARKAETHLLEDLRVALHGRSFADRGVGADFVSSYPARREGWLNIGLLHTGLDGARGHASYAPCSTGDLARFNYDYWALGHIHAAEIVQREPWIVYPGNLQGRSPRETGPKGAMRVTVEDGRVVLVEPVALDAARWAHETIDVSAIAHESEAVALIDAALAQAMRFAEGRPLAVRLTLTGESAAHARLLGAREWLEEEARALGFAHAADCWVERVKLATRPLPRRPEALAEPDGLDMEALVAAAADDPDFAKVLEELTRGLAEKLPRELREAFSPDNAEAMAERAALARDYLAGLRA